MCKQAFINLHGITADRVRRLCNLTREGKVPKDLRGSGPSGNAIPGSIVKLIEDHILEFPTKETHYSTRKYEYLDEKLNDKTMWRMFKEKHRDVHVDYKFYLKVFQEKFNFSFGRPQVDTCCQCEELNIKIKSPYFNDAAKRAATAELIVRKRRAKKFYCKLEAIKKEGEENPEVLGICMDYMQNLQLPAIPIQETFYLRQLTVNVFNIHDNHRDICFLYLS